MATSQYSVASSAEMSAFEIEKKTLNEGEEEVVFETAPSNGVENDSSELPVKGQADTPAESTISAPVLRREIPETMIDLSQSLTVIYCGICSMPPEFCEYGACFDRCRPWIEENCPEVLGLLQGVGGLRLGSGVEQVILLPCLRMPAKLIVILIHH